MNKTIVFNDHTSITAQFLEPVWKKFFQTEAYSKDKSYDPARHVFWADYRSRAWCQEYHNRGHKIVIDHLWDSYLHEVSVIDNNTLTLRCKNWIWYNESLWYQSLGYDSYIPRRSIDHSFLMLMNLEKPHRNKIFERVNLTHALYSYNARNIFISDDTDKTQHWQRYFQPKWYNTTAFSLVVESMVPTATYISEKTFKPLAYQHPFIVYGSPYTLAYLHELGFETFGHVIDEGYDTILDADLRLDHICRQIDSILPDYKTIFQDPKTAKILEHNRNLFFDTGIQDRFEKEIVNQVLEFLN